MNIRKDVLIQNKSKNTLTLKKYYPRIKNNNANKKEKNFITITLIKALIHKISPVAILFGFIMSVQFGFLNVISKRKMELLT